MSKPWPLQERADDGRIFGLGKHQCKFVYGWPWWKKWLIRMHLHPGFCRYKVRDRSIGGKIVELEIVRDGDGVVYVFGERFL